MQQSNGSDSSTQQNQPETNKQRQQTPQPVAIPQQWVPMQYPTAMVMPHHMMPPQHYAPPPYVPYHHHHHHQYQQPLHVPHQQHQNHQQQQHGSNGENKTLWIGDLHNWMDESYLHRCFASTGEVVFSNVH
jgi:hypothetical protein